jgi:hypothetical protein
MPVSINPLPPYAVVNSLLRYDPTTGIFRWKVDRGGANTGDVAGSDDGGYRTLIINGRTYAASRLAWLLFYGVDPGELQIDHIDRDKLNNRISNLRTVTHRENHQNRAIGASGIRGVTYNKRTHRWIAQITMPGGQQLYGLARKHLHEAAVDREWLCIGVYYPHLHRKS